MASQRENDDSQETPPSPSPSGLRRVVARLVSHRLRTAILAASILAAAAGIGLFWLAAVRSHAKPAPAAMIAAALKQLDEGHLVEAEKLAERLRDQGPAHADLAGTGEFILGITAAHDADNFNGGDKTRSYRLAARHLEEARRRGFPAGRETEGRFQLGRCLSLAGRTKASQEPLAEALKGDSPHRTEILWLLAVACLDQSPPQLAEALDYNQRCLSDPALPAVRRYEGLVQRAQILLQTGQVPQCLAALDTIPPQTANAAEVKVLRGWATIEEARARRKSGAPASSVGAKYRAAIRLLGEVPPGQGAGRAIAARGAYLSGVAFLELGELHTALARFVDARTQFEDTCEGQAANFEEAEIDRKAGRDDEALAAYQRALAPIENPHDYCNLWLPREQLHNRLSAAFQQYLAAKNFAACQRLTEITAALLPESDRLGWQADLHRSWGQYLLVQSERRGPVGGESLAGQGRRHWCEAGSAMERLSSLHRSSRAFPDDLWDAARGYFEGRDYRNAARMFSEYLKVEAGQRQPQALVNLGESLLALGKTEDALAALRECIDLYPRDPIVSRARLAAGNACLEKNDPERAEAFLRDNLNGDLLTPAGKEWRDSLFALGRLLYDRRRYPEALPRLEEAVQRYPDVPAATEARYLIAECHRHVGEAAREKLQKDLVETSRNARTKRMHESFQAALVHYREVQQLLGQRTESSPPAPLETAILRNTYFAVGDVLFALGDYQGAIQAYATATNHYQGFPEVLEAYLQIARSYQRLHQPEQARAALEQAQRALERIKPRAAFEETTNRSRQEWTALLAQLLSASG
jgi:tetratricopeptide (TPR) repeat protein